MRASTLTEPTRLPIRRSSSGSCARLAERLRALDRGVDAVVVVAADEAVEARQVEEERLLAEEVGAAQVG
jgi:hypothetical protein